MIRKLGAVSLNATVYFLEIRKDRSLFQVRPLKLLPFVSHLALDALEFLFFPGSVIGTVGRSSLTHE